MSSIHLTSGHDIGESELDLTSAAGGRDGGHVGEVLVLERRPGRDPVVGVVGQQAGQQLVPAQPEVRGQNLGGAIKVLAVVSLSISEWRPHLVGVGGRLPLGEHGLVVGEAGHAGPGLLGGRAEDPEYSDDNKECLKMFQIVPTFSAPPEELVNLRVPGEERLPRDHLREDAAQAPRVHAGRVELGS